MYHDANGFQVRLIVINWLIDLLSKFGAAIGVGRRRVYTLHRHAKSRDTNTPRHFDVISSAAFTKSRSLRLTCWHCFLAGVINLVCESLSALPHRFKRSIIQVDLSQFLKCNVQWIISVFKFRSFYFTSCAHVFFLFCVCLFLVLCTECMSCHTSILF